MQRGCVDTQLIHAICVHEAGHVFFLGHAGFIDPMMRGPKIIYDPTKNYFNGQGSSVKFNGLDQSYVNALDSREWLLRVANGHAAGGVCALILANSTYKGDGDDRDNFNSVFNDIKATNPSMTWTADWLWTTAQDRVRTALQNPGIKNAILDCAETLKSDLFHVS